MAPASEPGARPSELETLAVTGGRPTASRTGKVIRVPEPTMVLMVPAATPASRTAVISHSDIRFPLVGCCRAPVDHAGAAHGLARGGPPSGTGANGGERVRV